MMLVFNIILFFLKDYVIGIYTTNPEIRKQTLTTIWLICINFSFDCIKGILRGTTKAMGLYRDMLCQNIINYWILNFGMMYILAFKLKYGLQGIWMAKVI